MRWLLGAILIGSPAVVSAQVGDEEDVLVEESADQEQAPAEPGDAPSFVAQPAEALQPPPELEDDESLYWLLEASTMVHSMDNRDFRPLDESSDQAVLDTDDRRIFGYTDMVGTFAYRPVAPTVFNTRLKYDAVWPTADTGRSRGPGGELRVFDLNVDVAVLETEHVGISLKLGRQSFSIGGVPRDYMLAGSADAITGRIDLRGAGRIRVLGVDFFGGHDLPTLGYQAYRSGRETTFGLRGDTVTLRTGAVYELDRDARPDLPLEARAYYFYASIGGGPIEHSGADITRGGLNGNYSDADYQQMMGVRTAYVHDFEGGGSARLYGEFAYSAGIDRKPEEARDVDTSGSAYGLGLDLEWAASDAVTLIAGAEFYHFDGSSYASDGLEFERGFVGFKGARIGGRTVGRLSGWRPASHVDSAGVRHNPHDLDRVSGSQFVFARLGIDVYGTRLTADYWTLSDTSSSFLDIAGIDQMPEPPFGYTREEYRAQERLGRDLGQAIDLRLSQPVGEIVELEAGYSMFAPGAYYQIEVDRLAGKEDTALGGQETFWLMDLGARVAF